METRARIGMGLALVLAAAACGGPRPRASGSPGAEVLAVTGRIAGGPARFTAQDLASLPRREFRARDPRTGAEARYEGVQVARLLGDELEIERGADVAIFSGRDGYVIAIPLGILRQNRPVLADRVDGLPISKPGALVLAWPTTEQPGLEHDPRLRSWWVDAVEKVEVVPWMTAYGKALRVPSGAPDEARAGSTEFANSCMPCHQVRGAGGSRGPDLSERFGGDAAAARLEGDVREHERRTHGSALVDLSPQAIRNVASFLHVVAIAGPFPGSDDPPEPSPSPAPPPRSPGARFTPPPR